MSTEGTSEMDVDHIYRRIVEMTNEIANLDRKWHARHAFLVSRNTTAFHIDNDIVLKNLSGASRTLSDLVVGLAAGLQAYRQAQTDAFNRQLTDIAFRRFDGDGPR